MDSFRLALLLLGGVFVVGLYFWGRRSFANRNRSKSFSEDSVGVDDWDLTPMRARRTEPLNKDLSELSMKNPRKKIVPSRFSATDSAPSTRDVVEDDELDVRMVPESGIDPDEMFESSEPVSTNSPRHPETLVALSVLAVDRPFDGEHLLELFAEAGLYYGEMNIFHAPADLERPDKDLMFSVVNILEPGVLKPETMVGWSTPGLLLFMRLPGPVDGQQAFEHMVATARYLARNLSGQMCDEQRIPLSERKIEELRERIRVEVGDRIFRAASF